ncbi:hypothetical protein DH2020_018299 [Rehmannia glutinosa]|uniref:UspA domain-containing protein n=1 Tax=Rehmannia glutinosa TaxID=99300 RepID=A0ABR0WM34_REHGL
METTAAVERRTEASVENKMKVLVAIDESDGSFCALRWALDQLFSNYPVSAGLELQEQEQNSITLVNVKAETLILQGDPKDKICQAAEELHVDLVVLGSRGLGTIKRALLGSVSNYCVHHVNCPVLIVKPPTKSAHD